MSLELIIFIIIMLVGIFYYRRFSSFIYLYVLCDMLLKMLRFLRNNTGLLEVKKFLANFPGALSAIYIQLGKSAFYILNWFTFFVYSAFFYYTFKIFIKRKK